MEEVPAWLLELLDRNVLAAELQLALPKCHILYFHVMVVLVLRVP